MDFTASIAVIGGSGLYKLDLPELGSVYYETPFGFPSAPVKIVQLHGHNVAFLARHGKGHSVSPSNVPGKANIAILKALGVKVIIAFSAVGSLQQEIEPRHFVVPTQLIDRTKHSVSFYDDIVGHCAFADPFTPQITTLLRDACNKVVTTHYDKTLVVMEGPAFSTRAESRLYRQWGCDIINSIIIIKLVSCLPESKLAREAEICYACVCMATDYDSWKDGEHVTVDKVISNLNHNSANAQRVLEKLMPGLLETVDQLDCVRDMQGSSVGGIVTAQEMWTESARAKLGFLFPALLQKS